tara:strand:- start:6046 stop:6276 length:231 start_codon:yes stop_codon:yes gene_type:complete
MRRGHRNKTGDHVIQVFTSDGTVSALFGDEALEEKMMRYFSDPQIGIVTLENRGRKYYFKMKHVTHMVSFVLGEDD